MREFKLTDVAVRKLCAYFCCLVKGLGYPRVGAREGLKVSSKPEGEWGGGGFLFGIQSPPMGPLDISEQIQPWPARPVLYSGIAILGLDQVWISRGRRWYWKRGGWSSSRVAGWQRSRLGPGQGRLDSSFPVLAATPTPSPCFPKMEMLPEVGALLLGELGQL